MLSAQKNRPAVHRQPAGFSFFLRAHQQKCKSMLVVREACKLQFTGKAGNLPSNPCSASCSSGMERPPTA